MLWRNTRTAGEQYEENWLAIRGALSSSYRAIRGALASNTRTSGEQYEETAGEQYEERWRAIRGALASNARSTGEQYEQLWRAIRGPLACLFAKERQAAVKHISAPAFMWPPGIFGYFTSTRHVLQSFEVLFCLGESIVACQFPYL